MKKLSDVCKIVGVTRRTLQEYDRIKLLKPTHITDSGRWFYDDTAIQKLILIRVFVEAGYERLEIKSLLESPTLDLLKEFDCLIETLTEKRKKIDGMINTIRAMKLVLQLPENTLRAYGNLDLTHVYKDKSFKDCLKESIAGTAEYSDAENAEAELYMPFMYNIIAIGCYMGKSETAKIVQAAVETAYRSVMEIATADDSEAYKEVTEAERAEAFLDLMQELITDSEIVEMVDSQCGDGATAYIAKAVQVFSARKKVYQRKG